MYMKRSCNCGCNNTIEENHNMYQTACSNVINSTNMYDPCECGFDEENSYFPENPMLAQSYVPIQTMDKVFIPSVRIKYGDYFPRTCKPIYARASSRRNRLY